MIGGAVAVGKFARFGLLGDVLLGLLDQVDAQEDDEAGKKLRRALDAHQDGPVRGTLANRLDLAELLHVLQTDEDHAKEHGDALEYEDPDDFGDSWRITIRMVVIVEHLVDSLDEICANNNVDND